MLKLEHCFNCKDNKFFHDPEKKLNRFKCKNVEARRKNGNYRILNKRAIMWGHFPGWCPLEDYVIFRGNNEI